MTLRTDSKSVQAGALLLLAALLLCSCAQDPGGDTIDGRLSAVVAFVFSSGEMQQWLQEPGLAYVQAKFKIPEDLADDVMFGVDHEFIEGVENPIHFEGADWMALAGVTRNGVLWLPVGTQEALQGKPSDAGVWEYVDLGVSIRPDVWYTMRLEADFGSLRFHRFSLTGPGVDVGIELDEHYVDYPNYINYDKPSLTFYVYALRSSEWAAGNTGSTTVVFDDVEGGIQTSAGWQTVFSNGFESQTEYGNVPWQLPVSPLSGVTEFLWYLENEDALVQTVTDEYYRGTAALSCNATLQKQQEP